MSDARLPAGRAFARQVIVFSCALSVPALLVVLGCLAALLELTDEQWRFLFALVLGYVLVAVHPMTLIQQRLMAPLRSYLDVRRSGDASPDQRRDAFAALLDLPRVLALLTAAGWTVPVLLVSSVMWIRYPAYWGAFESGVIALACSASGFVTACVVFFRVKSSSRRVREELASELSEPSERRALIRPLRLRTKLLVCTTGATLIPIVFALVLSNSNTYRSLEEFTVEWQERALETMALRVGREDVETVRRATLSRDSALPATLHIDLVDPLRLADELLLEPHVLVHLAEALERGLDRGHGLSLPSAEVFSWRQLGDGRLLVARTPKAELHPHWSRMGGVFAPLLIASVGVALCLAWMLAGDVSAATDALRREAERLASGDLRRGRAYEAEDELGELSRAFEAMGGWLRGTVAHVVRATERVEGTAGELASVAEDVAGVTVEQVRGIQQAASSMDSINRQVHGLADSSQALNVSVEESSSSILELGAAGEELKETATILSTRVEEVSTSIEQMVRSVRQVSENTEGLSAASVETSASMEEMAASMRQVDSAAEETARLSKEVVDSAEAGQIKVRQTIAGMDAIRDATETAERVIRSLGERTTEIGAIVDVIDDVADETNLLALNAAIIAAQAGEHGRAFSVVADEIKDLADRVLASTKEIGGLIRAVQEEAGNAIGAIERGTASVASGVDLSAEAGISLEDITRASRESGRRIAGIVSAVREQAKAASHVVYLMERVRGGIDEIRSAAAEQDRGNEVVHRSSVAMRDVSAQVRGTTEEQARGSIRLRESIEEVRETVEGIHESLQEQSAACRAAVEFLEAVYHRTRTNEESAQRLDHATRNLLGQAETLRQAVQRFQI